MEVGAGGGYDFLVNLECKLYESMIKIIRSVKVTVVFKTCSS